MIRVVLCEEKNCNIVSTGMETTVLDNFLALRSLGDRPVMVNDYTIWFPSNKGREVRCTHIALLPEDGHRGIVTRLTRPIQVRKRDTVSFVSGGISFGMAFSGEEIRWVEE
jgi:hypothetical protein